MKKTFKRSLVWFSNNLRTQSNQLIQEAINLSESILFVFIVDERQELKNDWGFNKMGTFRLKHQLDALYNLKELLLNKGIHLHIYKGNPVTIIPEICKRNEIEIIFKQVDFAHDEIQTRNAMIERGVKALNMFLSNNPSRALQQINADKEL
jgi:deoxyribodipyrimidine photo-lyase